MAWCYIPFKETTDKGEAWCVKELYYGWNDDPKEIHGTTENAITPYGDTLEELIENLEMMLSDLKATKWVFSDKDGQLIKTAKESTQ